MDGHGMARTSDSRVRSFTKCTSAHLPPKARGRRPSDNCAELASIGITVIEMMPIADFPGEFGWGYDGVDLFAPAHLYGTSERSALVYRRAHASGLAVILDVVYNHFGPDGNYLRVFSDDYFTAEHENDWGDSHQF